ncbi:MAG: lysylphosphatidylglycerol synthase domain-containing protein [Polyangiaceae bacterium]
MRVPSVRRAAAILLRWGLAILLILGVVYQFGRSYAELKANPPSFAVSWSALSLLALALFLFIAAEAWRAWMGALGEPMGRSHAFRVFYLSNLGKYLPGGVWNFVGRIGLAQRDGISALGVSISILLEMACQLVGATLVALPTLLFFPALFFPPNLPSRPFVGVGVLLLVALGLVLAMNPKVMNVALAIGERVSRRSIPRIPTSYAFILRMLFVYWANWLLLSLAFAALAQALLPEVLSPSKVFVMVGAFALACNAGVFVFFLPGGLGVREVVLTLLLSSRFDPPWPATLALAGRLWILVGEVGAFGVALGLGAWARRTGRRG